VIKDTPSSVATTGRNPFVTIAIPTYNRASWLDECLRTTLAQSYDNFEVLVSDNASTDGTAEQLKKIDNARLRVLTQQQNIGLIPNWNACLAAAKGEYIIFVSDDDRIAPWLLDRCVSLVDADPDVAMVVALSKSHLAEEDLTIPATTSKKFKTGVWSGVGILQEYLQNHISASMCTIMIRTETLRGRGGFPSAWPHAADTAGWAPILLTGKAGLVNEYCGTCGIHGASETSKFSDDVILNDLRKLVDLISAEADRNIGEPRMRQQVKLQARRFFTICMTHLAVSHRRQDAKFVDVARMIWKWRRDLAVPEAADCFRYARPLAILLAPLPAAKWIRRFIPRPRRAETTIGRPGAV